MRASKKFKILESWSRTRAGIPRKMENISSKWRNSFVSWRRVETRVPRKIRNLETSLGVLEKKEGK